MRLKRKIIEGAAYHVTSRVNRKEDAFSGNGDRKIMIMTIEDAKEKFGFKLHNFCVMPNHIHLLITPAEGTNLSKIIQWIKTISAKRLNFCKNKKDHLWGERFFSRPVIDINDYFSVYDYINYNPVKAELVNLPQDWKGSGAYQIVNGSSLVDYTESERRMYLR